MKRKKTRLESVERLKQEETEDTVKKQKRSGKWKWRSGKWKRF